MSSILISSIYEKFFCSGFSSEIIDAISIAIKNNLFKFVIVKKYNHPHHFHHLNYPIYHSIHLIYFFQFFFLNIFFILQS